MSDFRWTPGRLKALAEALAHAYPPWFPRELDDACELFTLVHEQGLNEDQALKSCGSEITRSHLTCLLFGRRFGNVFLADIRCEMFNVGVHIEAEHRPSGKALVMDEFGSIEWRAPLPEEGLFFPCEIVEAAAQHELRITTLITCLQHLTTSRKEN